jgi:hypothetical protein
MILMQYLLLYNETTAEMARGNDTAQTEEYWGAWNAYMGAMGAAGVITSGNALQLPHTATTVRIEGGTRHVQDGPYADTKEMLGGYVVIEVPDLDAALEWAARAPCASAGSVEIRPVMVDPGAR